jgi:RHS repeat-associated protein
MSASRLLNVVQQVEGFLPALESSRTSSALANDLYEAASYWVDLGRWVLEGNTAVNFPERAAHEIELLGTLVNLSKGRPEKEQEGYAAVFSAAQELLAIVSATMPPEEGHLGFLRTVEELFRFVVDSYGFRVVDREPTLLRYSSGAVYLNLECSKNSSIACSFGPESERKAFWIDDLLFMFGDARYRTLPQVIALDTPKDVTDWFGFVADVFKRYGREVLSNDPAIFQRLEKAQDDFFDARYFSGAQGRFTTPDWQTAPTPIPYSDLRDPQSLNLYSYVRNNPLSSLDANGHCNWSADNATCLGSEVFEPPSPPQPLTEQSQTADSGESYVQRRARSGKGAIKEVGNWGIGFLNLFGAGITPFEAANADEREGMREMGSLQLMPLGELSLPEDIADAAKLLDAARAARNALAGQVGKKVATVTAGYNTKTGAIAAAACSVGPVCAETNVVTALGGDASKVKFTEAVRLRTGNEVPVCTSC